MALGLKTFDVIPYSLTYAVDTLFSCMFSLIGMYFGA
jgi:hypothetical protein